MMHSPGHAFRNPRTARPRALQTASWSVEWLIGERCGDHGDICRKTPPLQNAQGWGTRKKCADREIGVPGGRMAAKHTGRSACATGARIWMDLRRFIGRASSDFAAFMRLARCASNLRRPGQTFRNPRTARPREL